MSTPIHPKGPARTDWSQSDSKPDSKEDPSNPISNLSQKALDKSQAEEPKSIKEIKPSPPTPKSHASRDVAQKTLHRETLSNPLHHKSSFDLAALGQDVEEEKSNNVTARKPISRRSRQSTIEKKSSNLGGIQEVPEEFENPNAKAAGKTAAKSIATIAQEFNTIQPYSQAKVFTKAGEEIMQALKENKIRKEDQEGVITEKIMRLIFEAIDSSTNTSQAKKVIKLKFIDHLNRHFDMKLSNFLDTYTTNLR